MTCVREAWLTLGGLTMPLEDRDGGWVCTSLDLGFPEVRAVVNNRPDADGIDDRTQFFGARSVAAVILVNKAWGARIDEVAAAFAPFMVPTARPVLHYILDRGDNTERTMTLRAADYGWPIAGDDERNVNLQWVAADPAAYSATVNTAIAWAGSSTSAGRSYDLIFNRTYPTGGGVATSARIRPAGDLPVQPLVRIYGPIQAPIARFSVHPGDGTQTDMTIRFISSFILGVNEWVDVDTAAKTAYKNSDPAQSVFSSINFASTQWPVLPPNPTYPTTPTPYTDMSLQGSGSMNNVTQVQAIWQDKYLT